MLFRGSPGPLDGQHGCEQHSPGYTAAVHVREIRFGVGTQMEMNIEYRPAPFITLLRGQQGRGGRRRADELSSVDHGIGYLKIQT